MFVSEVPKSKLRVLQVFTTWKLQLRWSNIGFLRYKIEEYLKMMLYSICPPPRSKSAHQAAPLLLRVSLTDRSA